MPDNVRIEWVSEEGDIDKLDVLMDEQYIGIDSEWRPTLTQYH